MSSTASPIQRPSLALLGTEPWRAAFEFASFKLSRRHTPPPPGDGHLVIIFPGLASDGKSVAPLREHCQSLGYTAIDWGRGYNKGPQGDMDRWMDDLSSHVSTLIAAHGDKATLIGWSLGGIYARELGKMLAPQVRQVISIGTPFNAETDHTNVGWLFRLLCGIPAGGNPALNQRLRTPPPVPTTSIYSRSDGIVAWQTCTHPAGCAQVQDVEISGSHIGMGWNRAVLRVVGDRLAQKPESWRRYRVAR